MKRNIGQVKVVGLVLAAGLTTFLFNNCAKTNSQLDTSTSLAEQDGSYALVTGDEASKNRNADSVNDDCIASSITWDSSEGQCTALQPHMYNNEAAVLVDTRAPFIGQRAIKCVRGRIVSDILKSASDNCTVVQDTVITTPTTPRVPDTPPVVSTRKTPISTGGSTYYIADRKFKFETFVPVNEELYACLQHSSEVGCQNSPDSAFRRVSKPNSQTTGTYKWESESFYGLGTGKLGFYTAQFKVKNAQGKFESVGSVRVKFELYEVEYGWIGRKEWKSTLGSNKFTLVCTNSDYYNSVESPRDNPAKNEFWETYSYYFGPNECSYMIQQ